MRPEQSNPTPGVDVAKRYGVPCCASAACTARPERDDTDGAVKPPPDPDEPPPEVRRFARGRCRATPAGVASGRVRGCLIRTRLLLDPTGGLLRAARLFLCDELTELCLGISASVGVLGGEFLGLRLGVDERLSELFGLLALVVERLAFIVDVGNQRVEFVGRHVTGTECDLGEFLALEGIVQIGSVLEERAEWRRATADERAQGHLAEVGPQHSQLRFLLGNSRLGIGDLHVELALGVDRVVVLLAEVQRALFEALQLIDDVFDLLLLLVDRLRLRNRRGHGGNEERHGNGDRDDTEKLPHSYEKTA